MNFLRKIFVSLCAALLSASLFSLAWSHVAVATVGNRQTIKGWLDKSDAYSKVVDIAITKLEESTKEGGQSDIPVDDPQIRETVRKAFTSDLLKQNVETFLDGTYSWLERDAENLEFRMDFTAAKQQLADGLAEYVKTRATSLPVCTPNQIPEDFSGFSESCRPSNVSPDQVAEKIRSEILTGKGFLENPVITADNIKVTDENGATIPLSGSSQAQVSRDAYNLSTKAPAIFAVTAFVLALGVIFLSHDRLAGVKRVGIVLLTTGVILLIAFAALGAVANFVESKAQETVVTTEAATEAGKPDSTRELLAGIVEVSFKDIRRVLLMYTVGYIGVGVGALVGGSALQKRRDKTETPKKEEKPHDILPEPKSPAVNEKSEPKKSSEPTPKSKTKL